MASFSITLEDREVRIETRSDKPYAGGDWSTLQLSTGVPGHTGWVILSRSQALMVAEALSGLAHDLVEPIGE